MQYLKGNDLATARLLGFAPYFKHSDNLETEVIILFERPSRPPRFAFSVIYIKHSVKK